MNALEWQRPAYRDPAHLTPRDVCPNCKRLVTSYRFATPDGHQINTYHCAKHGDVVPMRSAVVNP